jgi:hypothetical protein
MLIMPGYVTFIDSYSRIDAQAYKLGRMIVSDRALSEIWEPLGIEVVPLADEQRCIAIKNPGERLSKKALDDLYEILRKLWNLVTGQDMKRFWSKKKKARFLEELEELYLITNARDEIVGFNGWLFAGGPDYINIYVDLIGKLSDDQEAVDFGLTFLKKTIIERAFARFEGWRGKPIYVSARTQSPVVYLLAQKMVYGSLYPNPSEKAPPEVQTCARAIANKLGIEKETVKVNGEKQKKQIGDDLIWRDAYNPPLYQRRPDASQKSPKPDAPPKPPKNEFERIDKFFKEHLGERDAFILVGLAKIPNVRTPSAKVAPTVE